MSKQPVQKRLFHFVLLSIIIVLIGGGAAFLYHQQQGSLASHASADNVVGSPTLPAANVDAIFRRLGSPMVGTGEAVEAASRAQNIDDAFALAVWWTETNDGAAGVGNADLNPGSVRGSVGYPSAYDGYTIYPSFTAAVNYWFGMMKKVYIDRGLTGVYAISHPYVGTSTSDLWAAKVVALMQKYHGEAPPTPTPTATVSADQYRNARTLAQQQAQYSQVPVSTEMPDHQQTRVQVTLPAPPAPPAPGLRTGTRQILVLLCLGLALILTLSALYMNRRVTRSAKLADLLGGDIQERLRVGMQQPATLFKSFTGNLEDSAPNMGTFFAASPTMPVYNPAEAFFSASASHSTQQGQFLRPQMAQTSTEQLPTFNASLPGFATFAPRQGSGLQAQPLIWSGQSLPDESYHRQGQQPRATEDLPPISVTPASVWDQIQSLATGQLSPSVSTPGTWSQPWSASPEVPSLSGTTNSAWNQPQPVGEAPSSGRSNGLLSRYREMQAQERQP